MCHFIKQFGSKKYEGLLNDALGAQIIMCVISGLDNG